jgi:hypothetical protein
MNSNTAKIAPNLIGVKYTLRADLGTAFLEVEAPGGWDDVQKLVGKVLEYDGRNFRYSGWNSDRNVAYFSRSLVGNEVYGIAKIL